MGVGPEAAATGFAGTERLPPLYRTFTMLLSLCWRQKEARLPSAAKLAILKQPLWPQHLLLTLTMPCFLCSLQRCVQELSVNNAQFTPKYAIVVNLSILET